MKVKDVIKFLSNYPPNSVVLGAGYAPERNKDGSWNCIEGELNVAEDKGGKPYLTVYGVEVVIQEDKTHACGFDPRHADHRAVSSVVKAGDS